MTPPTRQAKLIQASTRAGSYLVMHASTPNDPLRFSYVVRNYGARAADWKVVRVGLVWAAPVKGVDGPVVKRIDRWTVWAPSGDRLQRSEGAGLDDFDPEELDLAQPK